MPIRVFQAQSRDEIRSVEEEVNALLGDSHVQISQISTSVTHVPNSGEPVFYVLTILYENTLHQTETGLNGVILRRPTASHSI